MICKYLCLLFIIKKLTYETPLNNIIDLIHIITQIITNRDKMDTHKVRCHFGTACMKRGDPDHENKFLHDNEVASKTTEPIICRNIGLFGSCKTKGCTFTHPPGSIFVGNTPSDNNKIILDTKIADDEFKKRLIATSQYFFPSGQYIPPGVKIPPHSKYIPNKHSNEMSSRKTTFKKKDFKLSSSSSSGSDSFDSDNISSLSESEEKTAKMSKKRIDNDKYQDIVKKQQLQLEKLSSRNGEIEILLGEYEETNNKLLHKLKKIKKELQNTKEELAELKKKNKKSSSKRNSSQSSKTR